VAPRWTFAEANVVETGGVLLCEPESCPDNPNKKLGRFEVDVEPSVDHRTISPSVSQGWLSEQ